jgi:hypothetical protein
MIAWIRTSGPRCRAFAVALLLLCLVIQPAMVFACDLHDLAHAATSQAGAGGVDDADASAVPDRGEGGALLHDLLHAVHCCGHAPALPADAFVALFFEPASPMPVAAARPAVDVRSSNLLRPPIAA